MKEISNIVKKIQKNNEKVRDSSIIFKKNQINDKISEESTKKLLIEKQRENREKVNEDKKQITLTLLQLKNIRETFLDKLELINDNFKTSTDFKKAPIKNNKSLIVIFFLFFFKK